MRREYIFGFNGQEKETEITNTDSHLDFGERIYDSRLGRFLSIDPKYRSFPSLSSYVFAGNSPIVMVDLFGEKGTIYIQVMKNKEGKPVVSKETMDKVKKMIEEKGKKLNVDWKVEIVYDNNVMTREKFKNRKGADNADSYILIGTAQQLVDARNDVKEKEENNDSKWGIPYSIDFINVSGTSSSDGDVNMHYINSGNLIPDHRIKDKERFSSTEDKLYLAILHEDGHPKFKGYKKNKNSPTSQYYMSSKEAIGHVYDRDEDSQGKQGNIMNDEQIGDFYDVYMTLILQGIHGKIDNKPQWKVIMKEDTTK
jgi:RHS repeat-associated protein